MTTSTGSGGALDSGPLQPAARAIRVALGARAYDVHVGPGLIYEAGRFIAEALGAKRCAIVTDANVAATEHHGRLERSLAAAGVTKLGSVVLAPGEATKCFSELQVVVESLLEFGVERRDVVIALGGGVIGDLTGFAAAILRRGVRFVQVPTSLLAQVDSSVGGKTGINTAQGKNLAGAFHQPSLVLADTGVLSSLADRQLRAGYAEIAKHAALGDAGYLSWLEANVEAVMRREPAALVHAVARSVEMKAEIVARDETEQGDRMLLNLGHTFGHALEAWAGYSDRLLHGEAVAIGTAIAFRFSAARGLCAPEDAVRIARHLEAAGLPTRIAQIPQGPEPTVAELMRLMAQDKKVQGGRMTFILANGIGKAFVARDVEGPQVERWLAGEIAGTA
jgi:3-dehydroquinate synthase